MWMAFSENAAEWSIPVLLMFSITLVFVRFSLSISLGYAKTTGLFILSLLLTTVADIVFQGLNRGVRLTDAEPLALMIPNVFTVPIISSAVAIYAGIRIFGIKAK